MKESAYKEAGVDIDAGEEVVERIKPHVRKTLREGVMGGLGGFGALFDMRKAGYKDPILVSSTDGVGTKLRVAIDTGYHDTVGIDLVAMCVNDIIVQGAEPLFFLDYFACGKLHVDIAERVIAGIARGCRESGCALIGGETAEMPGVYAEDDYDLAGFTVGAVERDKIITGERIKEGDVILGLASSGLHSNGYSLVRKLVKSAQGLTYESAAPFQKGTTIGEALMTPTRLYVKSILAALKVTDKDGRPAIKGMANITGGGLLENIPRILPDGLCADLDASAWALPPLFRWLGGIGRLDHDDLARTLNCGIGMVAVCAPDTAEKVSKILTENGDTISTIGTITRNAVPVVIRERDKAWTWL